SNGHRYTRQTTATTNNGQGEVHRRCAAITNGHGRPCGDHNRNQCQRNDLSQYVIQERHTTPGGPHGISDDDPRERIPAKPGRQRENMFVLLNGFNKMLGAEAWRSGKYDYIGKGDGLQIGVESIESSGFGHINFFRGGYFLPFCVFIFFTHQVFIALLDPILERVCHRYQLDVLCRTQSLGSSPGPSTATSDYSYFNG